MRPVKLVLYYLICHCTANICAKYRFHIVLFLKFLEYFCKAINLVYKNKSKHAELWQVNVMKEGRQGDEVCFSF